ncbi:MAG: GntR family transcriptional regulator [Lachnospiraceae bacterium]
MEEQKAKYEEIVDWIKEKLDNKELEHGSKLPSENELKAIFRVSRQTVRHAFSVLEKQGVIERRRGSGTYIKIPQTEERKPMKTMRVAVVTTYVNEYIFAPIIHEVEKVLSKSGYDMQLSFTNNAVEKERMILKGFIKNMTVDGIIAEPTKSGLPNPNLLLYREIMDSGVPVIFINSFYRELDAPHVSMNDKMVGKMVTEHLLQCGHRNIGGIFKSDDGQGHSRYAGYMEALMEADLKVKGERIAWIDTEGLRGSDDYFGWVLKRLERCTACVCYNDEVANKLVAMCLDQGIRVPDDLSIIGIDNSDLAIYCEVPLTSAEYPINDLGRIAAQGIVNMISGHSTQESIELNPAIIIRNSVKIIDSI